MGAFEIAVMFAVFVFGCLCLGYAIRVTDGQEKHLREVEEEWKKIAASWEDLAKTTKNVADIVDAIAAEEEKHGGERSRAMAAIFTKLYGKRMN